MRINPINDGLYKIPKFYRDRSGRESCSIQQVAVAQAVPAGPHFDLLSQLLSFPMNGEQSDLLSIPRAGCAAQHRLSSGCPPPPLPQRSCSAVHTMLTVLHQCVQTIQLRVPRGAPVPLNRRPVAVHVLLKLPHVLRQIIEGLRGYAVDISQAVPSSTKQSVGQ